MEKIRTLFDLQHASKSRISKTGFVERKQKLQRLLESIIENQDKIEQAVFRDFMKNPIETRFTEILPVILEIKHARKKLKKWMAPKKKAAPLVLLGASSRIIFEPKGNTLIIAPWNYPFNLSIGPVVSSVAAGNTFILKPSEKAPHTSTILKRIIGSVFDESEGAVIEGGKEESEALSKLPFDHIFYTGGDEVGKIIMSEAAKNLTSVTLELGGKSPAIVDQNCNLKDAAAKIAWGKFINCGQTCIAPDYVLVPASLKDKFIELIKKKIRKYYGDLNDLQNNKDWCRIISKSHYERIKNLVDEAVRGGAIAENINEENNQSNFMPPVILSDVKMTMSVMKEEIFGPALPVLTYNNFDEICSIVEENKKPLALYIFSGDKKFAERVVKNIPAGTTGINDVVIQFANPNIPFGGVNSSGIGKGHGYYGFKEFSNARSALNNKYLFALKYFYPPYTKRKGKLINMLIRYL